MPFAVNVMLNLSIIKHGLKIFPLYQLASKENDRDLQITKTKEHELSAKVKD